MNPAAIEEEFPRGLLQPELFLGMVSSVTARAIGSNFSEAGRPSGSHFSGSRYGRGEVGEFVLIEGQQSLLLGRIAEIRLREPERRLVNPSFAGGDNLDAFGQIQLLGCVTMHTLKVTAGVDAYPRIGDRIYAAPHRFIALLPQLMERESADDKAVTLSLGAVNALHDSTVSITPERLFGRHCAILGATGGGKSWTIARIIEECIQHQAKLILIDATGEYRGFKGAEVVHCHLGDPVNQAKGSLSSSLPPESFLESDFVALFEPSGKVQGPKLRAAIRSLRLAKLKPDLAQNGFILKKNTSKKPIEDAEQKLAGKIDDPRQAFDVHYLVSQIEKECVYPDAFKVGGEKGEKDCTKWGGFDEQNYSYCLSLIVRINGILTSPALACVFHPQNESTSLTSSIDNFVAEKEKSSKKLLRICLSGISYEYRAREIIANVIARYLLTKARDLTFQKKPTVPRKRLDNGTEARDPTFQGKPTVIIVDEAHNFLGRHIGTEDYAAKLDAFELIAKEGRKYGLNICLASQRPRDITEGVLSQMGTLIVHRLTNDRDREVVERACGELDRAASAFLPNLRPGEAAVIGTDFPIPLTLQISAPDAKPKSDGPDYQQLWGSSSPKDTREKP